MNQFKNIHRILLLSSLLLVFVNCFSQKNVSPDNAINKALKHGKIDFETYLKKIDVQNLSETDTILSKGTKLDDKAIKLLHLNSLDERFKGFYFCRKIDVSKNFLSIIISSKKINQVDWYLINYDQYFNIIDSLLVFKRIGNVNHLSSKILNHKVSSMEVFVDQGQAITQGWETKITENGKFEK